MKVIAIEGIGNCGKSTIINGSKDGLVKPIQERFPDVKFKFYGETARDVMQQFDNIQERDMQSFQDIIYHMEIVRIFQIKEDIRKQLYDVIFVDRTTLGNQIFAMENVKLGKMGKYNPIIYDPEIYDHIIYLNEPIGSYSEKNKAFSHYESQEFISHFDKYMGFCFKGEKLKTFNNYLHSQFEIDNHIKTIIEQENLLKEEK